MALKRGTPILDGRYRIERLIGEGAFTRVWLAEEVPRKLPVAIKELRKELLSPMELAEVNRTLTKLNPSA